MISEEFLEGNRRRYTATCGVLTDVAGPNTFTLVDEETGVTSIFLKTDPTTATFYRRKLARAPDDVRESFASGTDPDVTHPGLGVFQLELDYDDDGRYMLGFEGTGACKCYEEINVTVKNAGARP